MFCKKIYFILSLLIFYQSHAYTKSNSFDEIDSKNLSRYFSGIVAYDNNNSSEALNFFESSKKLLNEHDPYLRRYIYSLVSENKIQQAINIIRKKKLINDPNFFDANLLLIIDGLKKNNFEDAHNYLEKIANFNTSKKIDSAILETLKSYIFLFKEKKFLDSDKNFGNLSIISETFQSCYLGDKATESFFLSLLNDEQNDYSRYYFFYLSYLIENDRIEESIELIKEIDYINSTLLLSQGKSWIENGKAEKIVKVFSCKNHNDIVSEFFFLISNLYSSQDDFKKSNFYLNLSIYLNSKFVFNLSLIAENQYFNREYDKLKKTLKNFKNEDIFYYWYKIKKESQIISKQKSKKDSINYITAALNKIDKPNNKFLFDIASFYKNSEKYEQAIEYYSKILDSVDENSKIRSEILYRRGSCYERLGKYKKADKDLLQSLEIYQDDAYVLNYLAYSWLERNYKIDKAIEMLETAYSLESNDPYIIDSIGWAYYLVKDYSKAEKFLKRAVELMPDDPIVNDHYGDILWSLNRKIQAKYFWSNVLDMKDVEEEMLEKINIKLISGLKKI